jgi:hypothetical protein
LKEKEANGNTWDSFINIYRGSCSSIRGRILYI